MFGCHPRVPRSLRTATTTNTVAAAAAAQQAAFLAHFLYTRTHVAPLVPFVRSLGHTARESAASDIFVPQLRVRGRPPTHAHTRRTQIRRFFFLIPVHIFPVPFAKSWPEPSMLR